MNASTVRRLINLWPPLLFAGIRVTRISDDYREVDVGLRLNRFNRNYVGTHFGGSLFAMTDPFYMLMLINILGPGYVVWDKQASIDFIAPGRGTVTARFRLEDAKLAEIKAATANGGKTLPEFDVEIMDQDGAIVAQVKRVVYIRKKR